MKLELNSIYTLTLKEIILIVFLSVLLGAIFWIFAPLLIFTIGIGFIIYVAFTIYDAITKRTIEKIKLE